MLNFLILLTIAIVAMLLIILSTIRLKVKTPIKKVPYKTNSKPIKLNTIIKIISYTIYMFTIVYLIILIVIFGPWVLYYIEMHY